MSEQKPNYTTELSCHYSEIPDGGNLFYHQSVTTGMGKTITTGKTSKHAKSGSLEVETHTYTKRDTVARKNIDVLMTTTISKTKEEHIVVVTTHKNIVITKSSNGKQKYSYINITSTQYLDEHYAHIFRKVVKIESRDFKSYKYEYNYDDKNDCTDITMTCINGYNSSQEIRERHIKIRYTKPGRIITTTEYLNPQNINPDKMDVGLPVFESVCVQTDSNHPDGREFKYKRGNSSSHTCFRKDGKSHSYTIHSDTTRQIAEHDKFHVNVRTVTIQSDTGESEPRKTEVSIRYPASNHEKYYSSINMVRDYTSGCPNVWQVNATISTNRIAPRFEYRYKFDHDADENIPTSFTMESLDTFVEYIMDTFTPEIHNIIDIDHEYENENVPADNSYDCIGD